MWEFTENHLNRLKIGENHVGIAFFGGNWISSETPTITYEIEWAKT